LNDWRGASDFSAAYQSPAVHAYGLTTTRTVEPERGLVRISGAESALGRSALGDYPDGSKMQLVERRDPESC